MFFNARQAWTIFKDPQDEDKEIETCGYLLNNADINQNQKCLRLFNQRMGLSQNPNELTPIICGVAGNDGRPNCTYSSPYAERLWHTHPTSSKSYPSTEDIIKTLKWRRNVNIRDSLILCNWGVWEFGATNKFEFANSDIVSWTRELKTYLDPIHRSNTRGRGPLTPDGSAAILAAIEGLKRSLSNFNFKIYFTSWSNIQSNYFLQIQ